jgi:transcriptional regulator with XRE-family HTH domain
MTQMQVAEKLGWRQPTIAVIERGKRRIDVLEFLGLADATGFDPAELLKIVRGVGDARERRRRRGKPVRSQP